MWFPYTLTFLGLSAFHLAARGLYAWCCVEYPWASPGPMWEGIIITIYLVPIGLLMDGFVFLRELGRKYRARLD